MRYFVTIDGNEHTIDVSELPGGAVDVRIVPPGENGEGKAIPLDAEIISKTGPTVKIDGRVFDLVVSGTLPKLDVFASGRHVAAEVETARMRAAAAVRSDGEGSGAGVVVSPMPGKIVKVLVAEGDEVEADTPVIVVEAMKMENELTADASGTVQKVHVQPGDAVEGGARLIAIG